MESGSVSNCEHCSFYDFHSGNWLSSLIFHASGNVVAFRHREDGIALKQGVPVQVRLKILESGKRLSVRLSNVLDMITC